LVSKPAGIVLSNAADCLGISEIEVILKNKLNNEVWLLIDWSRNIRATVSEVGKVGLLENGHLLRLSIRARVKSSALKIPFYPFLPFKKG